MSLNPSGFYLVERQDLRRQQREARQRVLQAALLGEHIDAADLAMSRGMAVRERKDSIFSDAWIMLAIMILVVGFIDNRNPALIALGAVLLLIVVVSSLWKNLALVGVLYQRSFDHTHVFPQEPVTMTLTVRNGKRLPLTWLRFRDTLPVAPESENVVGEAAAAVSDRYFLLNSYSLHAYEETQRSTTLRFDSRGFYRLGPVVYQSGDVFTLFSIEREYNDFDTIVVYPRVYTMPELGLPPKEPFGELHVHRSLFTDPVKTRGVRDYQPQDRFRDVHWKATARRGELQTKVYDPSTGMTLAIFLNVATMPRHWMGFYPEVLERAVSVAASTATFGAQQGWGVGVYANGSFPGSDQSIRVPPGRSPDQLTHILEALAAVTEFATASIEVMMLRESPRLPWVATIVLVTAVLTDEIMVALVRLQEAGRRVVLLSLAAETPELDVDGILVYHLPPERFAGLEEAILQPKGGTSTGTPNRQPENGS